MKNLFRLLVISLFVLCITFGFSIPLVASQELELVFIDVGQGDSALIVTPEGKAILIDAGETGQVSAVFKALNSRGIEHIDVIVASHPHVDHVDGLIDILEAYSVGKIIEPGKAVSSNSYPAFILEAQKRGIPIELAKAGSSLEVGSVKMDVLSPAGSLPDDVDDCSIVIKLSYGSFSALFPGDIGSVVENVLLSENELTPVSILKVSHHGSITSSSEAFLNRVMPKYSVVSVGNDNGYGHPSAFVLMRLSVIGSIVLRTDLNGDIIFRTDGRTIGVTVSKGSIPVVQKVLAPSSKYVASKNSDVFHYSTCSSVKTIKPGNLIVFTSREEAVKSGRRPCSICKP